MDEKTRGEVATERTLEDQVLEVVRGWIRRSGERLVEGATAADQRARLVDVELTTLKIGLCFEGTESDGTVGLRATFEESALMTDIGGLVPGLKLEG